MKWRDRPRRVRLLLTAIILVVVAASVTAVTWMLYNIATKTGTNVLTPGYVDVTAEPDEPEDPVFTPNPEDGKIGKNPTVQNTGVVPVWVRVRLAGGGLDNFDITINTDDWVPDGDYYYYKYPLATTTPDNVTNSLFNEMKLKEDVDYSEMEPPYAELDIAVYSESVQYNSGDTGAIAAFQKVIASQ